jgi:hypothetical protein
MNESLAELLRRSADSVREPRLDVGELVAAAGRRQRHRRLAIAAGAAGLVGVIVVGSLALRSDPTAQPSPAPSPSPTPTVVDPNPAPQPSSRRPLVYATGKTVHVGDETFEASKPVAFIKATDDGVVYEAAIDGTLWFTDGTTASVIGTSGCTACPTAHGGVVTAATSGSLVVWADATGHENDLPVEFVVFDTSRHEEVGRVSFNGFDDAVMYVDEDHVYLTPRGGPGCWALGIQDIHPCKNPHLFRFDVVSGETTKITLAELDAEMGTRSRMFVRATSGNEPGFVEGANFRQVGRQLVAVDSGGGSTHLARTNGDEVRLRLPSGYTAPGVEGSGGTIQVSQWLDDDHIALWADDGGGDLPAKQGDLLTCRLPDGVCRVEVPRTSALYVAPG